MRWVPWLCVLLMGWAAVAAVRVVRRHRGGRAWALRLDGVTTDDGVVVVPGEEADAFAVPGRPGHVVVTTGMRKSLDDEQYAALLAHERAHLDQGHPRLMLLSDLAGAVHPALRWVSGRVGYLVERAADEQAAAVIGDRRTLASAIGAAALASHGRPPLGPGPFASFARPRRPGAIPRRVAALLHQARDGRLWPAAVPAVLAVSSSSGPAKPSMTWSSCSSWRTAELAAQRRQPSRAGGSRDRAVHRGREPHPVALSSTAVIAKSATRRCSLYQAPSMTSSLTVAEYVPSKSIPRFPRRV
ncbi:M56 family metallopeptidase [Nonomuraea thailandensis]